MLPPIEEILIGALLRDPSRLVAVPDLKPADFASSDCALILGAMRQLVIDGTTPDCFAVADRLGLGRYIGLVKSLRDDGGAPANVGTYAEKVREIARGRRLAEILTKASESLKTPHTSPDTIRGELLIALSALDDERRKDEWTLGEAVSAAADRLDSDSRGIDLPGIATGITDLDRHVGGFRPGWLVVIGARPAMGKTALAMEIGLHAALKGGKRIGFVSAEMPAQQLAQRVISSLGRVDHDRVQNPTRLREDDWPRIVSAINASSGARLRIYDATNVTTSDVAMRARGWAVGEGLDLLIVDYLGRLKPDANGETRAQEVGAMVRALKSLVRALDIPVVLLCQLNRELERRPNKRPILADLRESGDIEQEADLVIFLYRDEVYHADSPDKGTAELIIEKNRHGQIGTIRTTFRAAYMRFEDFAEKWP